jgi:hypothetical protein
MKRRALIDNATLTAAQRLLGDIKVKNLYNIDGDISAFENLVQAILFFDEIACVDDYKPKFSDGRKSRFEFIDFVSQEQVGFAEHLAAAKNATEDVLLKVRGHEIDQADFERFFEMLRSHLVFNWQMSSSVYYLTVNLLADQSGVSVEEYSTLHAMIVNQLWGENTKTFNQPIVYKDKIGGRPEAGRDYGISAQVQTFAAALNWLALKTNLYTAIAISNEMHLVLHPIRHSFLAEVIEKNYAISSSTYDAITTMLTNGIKGAVRTITSATEPVISELKLPMWSAYLATKTTDPSEFLNLALELRREGTVAEARARLGELQQLVNAGQTGKYVLEVNKLNAELSKVAGRLLVKFGVSSRQDLSLAPMVNVVLKAKTAGALQIPEPLGRVPKPRALSGISDQFGFRGLMRSVVTDLVSIERLGALHDVITKNVVREKNEKFPIKSETSEWVGRNTFGRNIVDGRGHFGKVCRSF